MPSNEEHSEDTFRRYGVRASDPHFLYPQRARAHRIESTYLFDANNHHNFMILEIVS